MKRIDGEIYEDFKVRRTRQNKIDRIRRSGCYIWESPYYGNKVGKFTDKDSYILNDKFNAERIYINKYEAVAEAKKEVVEAQNESIVVV